MGQRAEGLKRLGRQQLAAQVVRSRSWIVTLPRFWKRVILATLDFLLLAFAVWLAMSLRYQTLFVPTNVWTSLVLLAAPAIGVAIFAQFGLYRLVTRYITVRSSWPLLKCVMLSVLIWGTLALAFGAHWVPRSVILALYPVIGGTLIFASRLMFAVTLRSVGLTVPAPGQEPRSVVVYGTGPTAMQLVEGLHDSGDARVVGLLDETESLLGQYIGGVKIYRPEKLSRLIEREEVKEVILALPESKRRQRRQILKHLQAYPVRVKLLPSIEDFASGRAAVSELRPVDVEDLLGRDPAPTNPTLLSRCIQGKAVMVTGAGGSIGSELVRQIIKQSPARLILFELSEAALYEIEMETRELCEQLADPRTTPQVVAVLGSVQDPDLVRRTILTHGIVTIFHAAAYKHVPIVETNPIAGLANNTFGTSVLAQAARDLDVARFVLISTDKAVRPTNIMGASKRLAEMILQALAADPSCHTVFSIVRFGNVLDSSGSVVRRFRKQIQDGGPITVTHPEIVRYFMSIPEAASLVLQAGAMAHGGDMFVLDMGEPVKIDELARSMVRMMGLELRDERNPDGDIQIEYIGLRPGEKLFEELLIGDNTKPTEHNLIRRLDEPHLPPDRLARELKVLRSAMEEGSVSEIEAVLKRTVEGYKPQADVADSDQPAALIVPSRTLH